MNIVDVEYLIVGAGPAGVQLGLFLHQAGKSYQILERSDHAGSFFSTYPRHRKLISINKVETGFTDLEKNLRWDWNSLLSTNLRFNQYSQRYFASADDFVRYLGDVASHHKLHIDYGVEVQQIDRTDRFQVQTSAGLYAAKRLIVATGLCKENVPEVQGIELADQYSQVSVDPEQFRGQRVLIIGKGNSGFETADNLVETTAAIHLLSPSPVKMAWRSHFVGHLRAVNNSVLDTYQLKSQNTILDARLERIEREGEKLKVSFIYSHAQGQRLELLVDRIVCCTGFRFDDSIFHKRCRPELVINQRFPAMTSAWESVNVPDLYFAGTLMQSRDYQKTFSGFVHGFRYNIEAMTHILEERYDERDWPFRVTSSECDRILEAVLERLDRSSSLFQQPGFLADVIAFSENESRYYESMPIDYVFSRPLGQNGTILLVTMEYGHEEFPDPFNIERFPTDGAKSHFIHPVLRRYDEGKLTAEFHVPEDLENQWMKDEHICPLREFLEASWGSLIT